MTMSRNQLRAARILLCLSQEELAALSNVGVATIRRYETGASITTANVEMLRAAAETAGAVFLEGQEVSGTRIGDGVALKGVDELPVDTSERLNRRWDVKTLLTTTPARNPDKHLI
ncbi:helix-turn-helix transcriptional regulator [Lichenihabitans sp. Uapishka_5]|uniref:helix-turn-helix domain-containing protein n=1 Tax=Lichenihabitans sp. Uapishka_5 TaxID=3037302 RepID=UPI0029E7F9AB|nr:helix-turn-helix transcriptional regulator [Lichenihabitans sp. Uapishka_5]MDX7952429.1 helix-turn-helix transcriptional regulator [Lichenihabitans sp. Uapishka_5]